MELNVRLCATEDDSLSDLTLYCHLVGSLVNLAATRREEIDFIALVRVQLLPKRRCSSILHPLLYALRLICSAALPSCPGWWQTC